MRLLRRRGEATTATYAAVLDGVHLWLDVDGPVAVRDDAGRTTELGPAPCDLSGLTAASYDVLAGGALVEIGALPGDPLVRTPLSPDGRTQWELAGDGPLRLHRQEVVASATLEGVDLRDVRLHLRVAAPVGAGGHLLLLDTDDRVRATLPDTTLGVDDLPAGYVGVLRLAVGTEQSWVRVRRRANDLADPHRAVLLPELTGPPGVRLRWNPDGLLALRVLE
ncbi:hypothetical protein G5V58_18035 [Nocardioides anomalus]|uniref:Uncharacterized protein n=1 Tax=Nocardioides anomalus TaxID=2712223 RepID=A0A6G6WH58_9ACTN|nr:hypothetical protein [Nocardioides anomalus]QIG44425.1 hypothetical protein G5V58_18035 [Nocardioides anomalus]